MLITLCSSMIPSVSLPSSLHVLPYLPWLPSLVLRSPSISLTSLLPLSCQCPSLDGSLITFLPKCVGGAPLPFSHSPHSCPRPSLSSSSSMVNPSPFLAADELLSDPRASQPPVPCSPNLSLLLLCFPWLKEGCPS